VKNLKIFRSVPEEKLEYQKSPGLGHPAKDPLLVLKMCLLQDLHGLSDEKTEFQVLDRTTFQRLLGLPASDKVSNQAGHGKNFEGLNRLTSKFGSRLSSVSISSHQWLPCLPSRQ
jgi:hypothetical protein